jgi:hypothetical protein
MYACKHKLIYILFSRLVYMIHVCGVDLCFILVHKAINMLDDVIGRRVSCDHIIIVSV